MPSKLLKTLAAVAFAATILLPQFASAQAASFTPSQGHHVGHTVTHKTNRNHNAHTASHSGNHNAHSAHHHSHRHPGRNEKS